MTYELDDTDMENLRDAAEALEELNHHIHMTTAQRVRIQEARDLISVTLQRAGRTATAEGEDPVCTCGVHRSEHALCGCPDGFLRRAS